jgi:MoxR-like ATPase
MVEARNTTSIQQLRVDLATRFPERKNVIDGALCAVLSQEHVLLLGPPGTAKSALTRAIAQAFSGRLFRASAHEVQHARRAIRRDGQEMAGCTGLERTTN